MGNSFKDQNKWNRKNQGGSNDEHYNGPTTGEKKKSHRSHRRADENYVRNIKKNGYAPQIEDDEDFDPFDFSDEKE